MTKVTSCRTAMLLLDLAADHVDPNHWWDSWHVLDAVRRAGSQAILLSLVFGLSVGFAAMDVLASSYWVAAIAATVAGYLSRRAIYVGLARAYLRPDIPIPETRALLPICIMLSRYDSAVRAYKKAKWTPDAS